MLVGERRLPVRGCFALAVAIGMQLISRVGER
jgi:hypothetical protein